LIFAPELATGVLLDGTPAASAPLSADDTDAPALVSHANLSFHIIFRESYGLRILDTQALARLNFQGVESFAIHYPWLIEARFVIVKAGDSVNLAVTAGQKNFHAVRSIH